MRVAASSEGDKPVIDALRAQVTTLAAELDMSWELHDATERARVLVLVSKEGHCLNDLLFRWRTGALPIDVVGVVSNHPTLAPMARSYAVPFHDMPVSNENRAEQEAHVLGLVREHDVDLVVLARYMQILTDGMCAALEGRAINIHHSFLPSFKGARPYHQAHDRGVKLIGATAHYVTSDLDEGPIIEQEVARVDHSYSPEALVRVGRDLECVALARAVLWHVEHRVLRNGARTVVFR
jgi:formyltetrahydrofolate deformylase